MSYVRVLGDWAILYQEELQGGWPSRVIGGTRLLALLHVIFDKMAS
jgi:hypothetical protein